MMGGVVQKDRCVCLDWQTFAHDLPPKGIDNQLLDYPFRQRTGEVCEARNRMDKNVIQAGHAFPINIPRHFGRWDIHAAVNLQVRNRNEEERRVMCIAAVYEHDGLSISGQHS